MRIRNPGNIRNRIIYTVLVVILLSAVFLSMINYAYDKAEDASAEILHTRTKEIKDDITLQMISDRENLTTIASIAEQLYAESLSSYASDDVMLSQQLSDLGFGLLFDSFESIGLIDEIAILLPNGNLITKKGADKAVNVSFEEEEKKLPAFPVGFRHYRAKTERLY